MKETEYTRHLDNLGRLVIPAKLRNELNMKDGDAFKFFLDEQDGKRYLCIECPDAETDLAKAMRIIKENGLKVVKD